MMMMMMMMIMMMKSNMLGTQLGQLMCQTGPLKNIAAAENDCLAKIALVENSPRDDDDGEEEVDWDCDMAAAIF